MKYTGIYLPVITPFYDGRIDLDSFRALVRRCMKMGIHGLIPLGTTGEGPTVDPDETLELTGAALEEVGGRIPVFIGVGGNDTRTVVRKIEKLNRFGVSGYLVTVPYYSRPSQEGIVEHFRQAAAATDADILIYNIPYRTGRNMENLSVRKAAALGNIAGIKDSCGIIGQSLELLADPPCGFSVFTGEDVMTFVNLTHGGAGGVLAAAHVNTAGFVGLYDRVKRQALDEAGGIWKRLFPFIGPLFAEPNPGPVKYVLHKLGLIRSPELRLPMTETTPGYRAVLDNLTERLEEEFNA